MKGEGEKEERGERTGLLQGLVQRNERRGGWSCTRNTLWNFQLINYSLGHVVLNHVLLQLSVFFQHEENEQCSAQHFLRGGHYCTKAARIVCTGTHSLRWWLTVVTSRAGLWEVVQYGHHLPDLNMRRFQTCTHAKNMPRWLTGRSNKELVWHYHCQPAWAEPWMKHAMLFGFLVLNVDFSLFTLSDWLIYFWYTLFTRMVCSSKSGSTQTKNLMNTGHPGDGGVASHFSSGAYLPYVDLLHEHACNKLHTICDPYLTREWVKQLLIC